MEIALLSSAGAGASVLQWGVTGLFFLVALWFYSGAVRKVASGKGEVAALPFTITDLMALLTLAFWLGVALLLPWLSESSLSEEAQEASASSILFGSAFLVAVAVGVGCFMQGRKISVREMCGIDRLGFGRVLGNGFLYMFFGAAFVFSCLWLTQKLLQERAQPQELVEFFHDAVKAGEWGNISAVILSASLLAPLVEEFLFRGYIYGVLRRFIGPWGGMVLASLAFGAVHFNLMGFPSLFLLALCFTLAYEATGSLLVPMVMHAIFNSWSLLEVFGQAIR